MAAALSMASAVQIQTAVADAALQRWEDGVIFSKCDESIYLPGGVYEMRLQCNN